MTKCFHRSLSGMGLSFVALLAMTPQTVRAQTSFPYSDNLGYRYNNPMSASIGTYLNESNKAFFVRQSLQNAMIQSSRGPYKGGSSVAAQKQRGDALIRRNQATMAFPIREFPVKKWLDIWGGTDPQKRDKAAKEWGDQKALWAAEIQARGAKTGDMGDMLALAFVSCMEGYNGERINNAGFHYMSGEFRKTLLKDAPYQGYSVDEKQDMYERAMLSGTYSLILRRQAQQSGDMSSIPEAQQSAGRFLDKWWDTKTSGAVKELAAYRTKSAPTTPTPASRGTRVAVAPAAPPPPGGGTSQPTVSFEEAKRATTYTPVAPMLIDQKLAANARDSKMRDFIVKLTHQMIDGTRSDMRQNATANLPVDNVARALASSLSACYMVAIARPGQQVGQGVPAFTKEQMEGLRRQVALVLASNPNITRMSDRDKQELSEVYLLVPALSSTLYNAGVAKSDNKAQEEARSFARSSFQGIMGVAPEKVHFTDQGITL